MRSQTTEILIIESRSQTLPMKRSDKHGNSRKASLPLTYVYEHDVKEEWVKTWQLHVSTN